MDIKQALKERIRDLKTELAKNEKALAALDGEKPAPKPKAAPKASVAPKEDFEKEPVPVRIVNLLVEYASKGDITGKTADSIAEDVRAPVGQVRTTCSRLVRDGRLAQRKDGRTAYYMVAKGEEKTDAVPSPFAGETN